MTNILQCNMESGGALNNLETGTSLIEKRSRIVWLSVLLFWTLIGAIAAVQEYIAIETRGVEVSWSRIILANLPIYFWAVLTPFIFAFGQKFALNDRKNLIFILPFHLISSLLFASIYLGIVALVSELLRGKPLELERVFGYFWYRVGRAFHVSVLTYWAVLGFGFAIDFYRRLQERELQSAKTELELETQLVQAKLDSLKMQLNPHFLFNTLNTVSAIMSNDLKGARRVIARLSELLRINLEASNKQTTSLKEEMDLLNLYLDIERERFAEKLTIKINVPISTWECVVPHFILQPLVENAIKHGINNIKEKGLIEITAKKEADSLNIQIRDNGKGVSPDFRHGVGLTNTVERLKKLYGDKYKMKLGSDLEGTTISLWIPCKNS